VNTVASKPCSALPFFAVALLSSLVAGSINPVSAATTTYTSPYAGGTIAPSDTVVLDDGATITGPITNNGTLQFNQTSGTLTMSSALTGSGTLSLTNAGTLMLTGTTVLAGIGLDMTTTVDSGRLLIGKDGGRLLYLGNTDGGVGTLSINGGYVGNGSSYLGYEARGRASVTVSSGTWANGAFTYVGWNGSATLNVTGGSVTGTVASIGRNLGSVGSVTVSSGGQWSLASNLTVGEQGTGSLTIGNGGLVVVKGNLVRGASGTINLNAGGTLQIGTGTNSGSLLGGSGSLTNNGTVVFNRGNASTYSGALSGSGAVTKLGLGTLTLGGVNTYTGATTVSGGGLLVSGSIANSAVTVQNGGTLGGSGTVGNTTVQSGGTINPGNSPGTLNINGDIDWLGGGNYNWQIAGATGTAGTVSTWDLITVTGALDLGALTSVNKFNINLWSLSSTAPDANGNMANFNSTTSYEWLAVSAGSITGFNAAHFAVNVGATNGTGGFSNPLDGGYTFGVRQDGGNLYVTYGQATPIPEPGTWAAMALFAGGAAFAGWRQRQRAKVD